MDDTEVADLRLGARGLIRGGFLKGLPESMRDGETIARLVDQLEGMCLRVSQEESARGYRAIYASMYIGLCSALPQFHGEFLEKTLAEWIVEGGMDCEQAFVEREDHKNVDPRKTYRGLFYRILHKDPRLADRARAFATLIEKGCYNATIARCVESAESYRRQWDSPMFVHVYSGRCGEVASNIDPDGPVVRGVEGGAWALDHLASGEWLPEDLGTMAATDLCPQASRAERDEIARRLNQVVEERTSSLFACPRCRKRNHTYRQVQIGAGDEMSTFMCTCKECGQNFEGRV